MKNDNHRAGGRGSRATSTAADKWVLTRRDHAGLLEWDPALGDTLSYGDSAGRGSGTAADEGREDVSAPDSMAWVSIGTHKRNMALSHCKDQKTRGSFSESAANGGNGHGASGD